MADVPLLGITDGTDTVTFFSKKSGYFLKGWTPSLADWKDGGIWASSPFADGRRPVVMRKANVVDALTLTVNGADMDTVIRDTQKLRRLLEKAVAYWQTSWSDEPVWIFARGVCETNTRYAVIASYLTPNDNNPFSPPFSNTKLTMMDDFTLTLEHLPWQHLPPGESEGVPVTAGQCYDYPGYISFNGTNTIVDLLSPAILDNLPDNAFTVEGWARLRSYGEGNNGRLFSKGGFFLTVDNANGLRGLIACAVTAADSASGLDDFSADSEWHHFAMCWDDAAAPRVITLFIDGMPPSYRWQIVANGAITPDAASNMTIGNDSTLVTTVDGDIGWVRFSNAVRYAGPFIPPQRCKIPDDDAATVWLGLVEGQGATVFDRSGNGNNGTATNYTWGSDCCD